MATCALLHADVLDHAAMAVFHLQNGCAGWPPFPIRSTLSMPKFRNCQRVRHKLTGQTGVVVPLTTDRKGLANNEGTGCVRVCWDSNDRASITPERDLESVDLH